MLFDPQRTGLDLPLNQIKGWTAVRESYSRASEQGPLMPHMQHGAKFFWSMQLTDLFVVLGSVENKLRPIIANYSSFAITNRELSLYGNRAIECI